VLLAARQQRDAISAEQEAMVALSPDEAERWQRYAAARAMPPEPSLAAKLAVTAAAYADPANPTVSAAMRRYEHAVVRLQQAQAHAITVARQRSVALAALALCLEAVGQAADAALVLRGSEYAQ
jgi:hypothetical protein